MSARKLFMLMVLVIPSFFSHAALEQKHKWNLLKGLEPESETFQELEIGDKIVYWKPRKLGQAIVEKDQVIYHFDKNKREISNLKFHWREDLPEALPKLKITKEQAEKMVKGAVEFSELYIISPESDVFPIKPTPKNPCWVVRSMNDDEGMVITIIDAVEGKVLGNGIVPPYTAVSLTGPDYGSCTPYWVPWRNNAASWFNKMGYYTESLGSPSKTQVRSHIQSLDTALFYELAHGAWYSVRIGCEGYLYPNDVENWIEDYPKMPFTFLGSCEGMCNTGDGSLSYEFRKGSSDDTVTVGYCHMSESYCSSCWTVSLDWQDALFGYMDEGKTVKQAFNLANADYPACSSSSCMRFAGDTSLKIYPTIVRAYPVRNITTSEVYDSIQEAIDDPLTLSGQGHIIVVYPGTYDENLDFKGKAITVRSTDPNDPLIVSNTIVKSVDESITVSFVTGEGADSILRGFTIGYADMGIYCSSESASEYGPTISQCIVKENITGLYCLNNSPSIMNCIFTDNSYESITCENSVTPIIRNNAILNSLSGIGLLMPAGVAEIHNNTIVKNDWGLWVAKDGSTVFPNVSNCIFWDNPEDDLSVWDEEGMNELTDVIPASYCCIESLDPNDSNYPECINDNPLFADLDADDIHLQSESPCIDAGYPSGDYSGQTDIDGEARVMERAGGATGPQAIVDMGADEAWGIVHNTTQDIWYYEIPEAIDDAFDDDVIVVYPGTYYGKIDFLEKNITLQSTAPNDWDVVESTVINGNDESRVVIVNGDSCVLNGLTITGGGYLTVELSGSSNILRNCIVENNRHGVYNLGDNTVVAHCIIRNNTGDGIQSLGQAINIQNSLIYNNGHSGVISCGYDISVANCTIVNNGTQGVYVQCGEFTDIYNCIVWNNGIDLRNCTATYSWLTVDGDPLFADTDFYHLQYGSPCVDAGAEGNYGSQTDIDGDTRVMAGRVDMGADETPPRVHNVTSDRWYPAINTAILDANNYDTIVVYPGTYYESLYMDSLPPHYSSQHIAIQSVDPNDWDVVSATVIDGNGVSNTIFAGFGTYPTFSGLTITGGNRGIYAGYPGSIAVSNCIIENNNSFGAYIYCCSNAAMNNCIIKDNTVEGIYLEAVGSCDLKNTLIHNNGTGIRSYGPVSADIHNCTIVDNSSYGIKGAEFAEFDIKNCIIWENSDDLYDCNAIYSCISNGDAGIGNISTDPCFASTDSNDFHLQFISPCVNAGDPNGDYEGQVDIDGEIRVFGSRVDMGADETTHPDGHWWKLDEESGTTAYDFIDDDDGTFNGSDPCWVEGIFGGAVECNGVNDYFSVSSLNGQYHPYSTAFSVAGWFRTSQSAGKQTIVGNWNNYSPYPGISYYFGWQVLLENNKVTAKTGRAGSTDSITGTTDVNDGQWHHFVFVYTRYNSNSYLYVDGQPEGTPCQMYSYVNNLRFRIGDASYVSTGSPILGGGPFNGTIDEIMLFDYTLSEEEIYQLYENGM